jgi:hypothetical protein
MVLSRYSRYYSRHYARNDRSVMTERVWAQAQPDTLDDLSRMRGREPLTHCITNIMAANFTANVLLAVGASAAIVVQLKNLRSSLRSLQQC